MYLMTSVTWVFVFWFFFPILVGIVYHVSLFYCISNVGAAHTSIISVLTGGIQIFLAYGLSIYLFYDVSYSIIGVIPIFI